MASLEEARAAKVKVGLILGDNPDVQGVGIARANGSFGLKVNLAHGRAVGAVPCDVDGVPVLVEVVGQVWALPPDDAGTIDGDLDGPVDEAGAEEQADDGD